ncbi:MarR family transcriptional regulator [Bifidobacterium animalis subsp. animalis MCC 1489]|uniref:MarR-type transcriptional regulator n=1 Tax=Bifidobacterium animalis subsp. animalis IM386 TaxID=1402194 RepID=A0AAV2W1U0_9BIFI|nr:MarR family transcriptional regulator [Bifidobacterium animalis]AFI62394.1 MarR-type transcriptional regulator [Bifidobacterium animalis subsp. animalis ATCC 25527]AYN23032.1 MarR-type transcriptional regulator [Bifidobacterium animalis subsp. animalis]KOA63375.1 MarR family transcriptional regulator [Bifidobacterium animalis subsp. animalis MCC 1489]CDI67217.1 MarR-type transcriptional regulator [Bifidobacterium animalis subsp. animalis IM386]
MDYKLEAVHELMFAMWASRSKATRSFERGTQGEMFVLRELEFQGSCTPSQLAQAMGATSGRISSILSGLTRKGWIVRTGDPQDRRSVVIELSDEGRRVVKQHSDKLVGDLSWVFSQMGERRTREFVGLLSEFMTYLSICGPNEPRPTAQQVGEAFERRARLHERMREMVRNGERWHGSCRPHDAPSSNDADVDRPVQ